MEKSFSGVVAQLAMKAALRDGVDAKEYGRLTGIVAADTRTDARVSAAKYVALLDLARQRVNARDLVEGAIRMPEGPPFGTVLALAANAPTLAGAFEAFLRYRPLVCDADELTVRRSGDEFEIDYALEGGRGNALAAFGNLRMMVQLAQQYVGVPSHRIVLEFAGNAFASLSLVQSLAGCSVRFGQARDRLRLVATGADAPYERFNRPSHDLLRRQAEFELLQLRQRASFAARVEGQLAGLLLEHDAAAVRAAPLAAMCDRLQVSRFVLHRRLQREGTNFQKVLAKARLAEAERLLSDRSLSIADISDLLGFSSPSAFSRFFSDSVGTPPSRYQGARGSI